MLLGSRVCTGLVMVKHEQTRPVLIAEMLFAAGDDRQAGGCFAIPELPALFFLFAMLADYGMISGTF